MLRRDVCPWRPPVLSIYDAVVMKHPSTRSLKKRYVTRGGVCADSNSNRSAFVLGSCHLYSTSLILSLFARPCTFSSISFTIILSFPLYILFWTPKAAFHFLVLLIRRNCPLFYEFRNNNIRSIHLVGMSYHPLLKHRSR